MSITEFIKANKIKGAIFDMDGTLTDSMGGWGEIYDVLFGHLGVKMTDGFIMRVNHMSMRNRVKEIVKEFSLGSDENEVYSFWIGKAAEFYEKVFKIKPYMLQTLEELSALSVKMAVATASDRRLAEVFIKSNNLSLYFDSVTGLDEVSRPKSFPDIYLKAAEKLGIKPCRCVVFEDALTAVKSAKNGGFYVCAVQDDCSAKDKEEIIGISDFKLGF